MRRTLALAVVSLALVAFVAAPVGAATRITCVANGVVNVSGSGPYNWSLAGTGPCVDSLQGNFLVTFIGSGTSDSLGLCGGLIVQNLRITVKQDLFNLRTLQHTFSTQVWSAPVTTFPVATPVLIRQAGALQGAGVIMTRILLSCPPAGSHVAAFVFTTTG